MLNDVDTLIKWATGVAVAIVTGIAAYISYTHIYSVTHSPLVPISIDGMIVTSSLVLLTVSRNKLETVALARVGLWLGILATLAANVAYGLPQGLLWAVVSAWPAVCFVVSVETVMQLARVKRRRRKAAVPDGPPMKSKSPGPLPQPKPERGPVYAKATTDLMAKAGVDTPKDLPYKGKIPSIRAIMRELKIGYQTASEVQQIMMRKSGISMQDALLVRNETKEHARVA